MTPLYCDILGKIQLLIDVLQAKYQWTTAAQGKKFMQVVKLVHRFLLKNG